MSVGAIGETRRFIGASLALNYPLSPGRRHSRSRDFKHLQTSCARTVRRLNGCYFGDGFVLVGASRIGSVYEAGLIGIETESGQRRGKQAVRMRPTVQQWIRDTLRATRVVPVALDAETTMDGACLHAMHPDPFDRWIVATAVTAKARLVTADAKIITFAKAAGLKLVEL
jgi:hypothetical protein